MLKRKSLLFFRLFLGVSLGVVAGGGNDVWGASSVEQKAGVEPGEWKKVEFTPLVAAEGGGNEKADSQVMKGIDVAYLGGDRLVFRIPFLAKPDFSADILVFYLDIDNEITTGRTDGTGHDGVDLMVFIRGNNPGITFHNSAFSESNVQLRVALDETDLYLILQMPSGYAEGEEVELGTYARLERANDKPQSLSKVSNRLKSEGIKLRDFPPELPNSGFGGAGVRFYNDKVAYETLDNKGLKREQIKGADAENGFEFPRTRPEVKFDYTAGVETGKSATGEVEKVSVHLLNEAKVARKGAWITFGVPVKEGKITSVNQVRVLNESGERVEADISVLTFWPDKSIKWLNVTGIADLESSAEKNWTVELGGEVAREAESGIKVTEAGGGIQVENDRLRVLVSGEGYNLFKEIWVDSDGSGSFDEGEQLIEKDSTGFVIRDEEGKLYYSRQGKVDNIRVEKQGAHEVIVRVDGQYRAEDGAEYMRYVTRIRVRSGSTQVRVEHTHINTELAQEFTDFRYLMLGVKIAGGSFEGARLLGEEDTLSGKNLQHFQDNEAKGILEQDGKKSRTEQGTGVLEVQTKEKIARVAVEDYWQKWPKGVGNDGSIMIVKLLPELPNENYGRDLPYYLMYPFVEGFYRLKWGMSFTERIVFDFEQVKPEEYALKALWAEANLGVVPVLPGTWYETSGATEGVVGAGDGSFADWDNFARNSMDAHLELKKVNREYGFLNYGDWFGERGRNWGNNEYDTAHGFLMHFMRTGERDFFRLGLATARHQADVDIVHAYPDLYYVGANHQHSIGHTGVWSQRPKYATWTHAYDGHTSAGNGHTWADGMVDAWWLTGDARVMESVYELGEHITWAFAPNFTKLGNHERSAGWSLKAIMAIYQATYDSAYLKAAKQITDLAIGEQDIDDSGTWPHLLPVTHAAGQTDAIGSSVYNIGVLLGGMAAYHEATQDEATKKSILAATKWLAKSWSASGKAWPYSAGTQGEPQAPNALNLNPLLYKPMAYGAKLADDAEWFQIVVDALSGTIGTGGAVSFGKELSIKLFPTPMTLALLKEYYARVEPGKHLFDGSAESKKEFFKTVIPMETMATRGGNSRVIWIIPGADGGTLQLKRTKLPDVVKTAPDGRWKLETLEGKEVATGEFKGTEEANFEVALPADSGRLKLSIPDRPEAVWTYAGDGFQVVVETHEDLRISRVGISRVYFQVPEGTEKFSVKLMGVHTGSYSGTFFDAEGNIVTDYTGMNHGTTYLNQTIEGIDQVSKVIEIDASKSAPGIWSAVLSAAGDIGFSLQGVDPLFSNDKDAIQKMK